jgi:hypothetical protein
MTTISNVVANIDLLRTSFDNAVALGESARAQDFSMKVVEYSDLTWLIQALTIPSIKREVVETVGPFGVRWIQQGRFINEIEMAITFKDVVNGIALQALQNWSENKRYLTVAIALKSESEGEATDKDIAYWEISDCWLELDGADLSVEDAVPLKLSGTLHGSYFPNED